MDKKIELEEVPPEFQVDFEVPKEPFQHKYRCACCKKMLPLYSFYSNINPKSVRPVSAYCKECCIKNNSAYPKYDIMKSVLDWRGCVVCGTLRKCYEGLPCKSCLEEKGLQVCRHCKVPQPIANFGGRIDPTCLSCRPTRDMKRAEAAAKKEKEIHCQCQYCGQMRAAAGDEHCSGCKLVLHLEQEFSPSLNAWANKNGFVKLDRTE